MVLDNGYETKTTFFNDFFIANQFGKEAVIDTFERAFEEWKDNLIYICELAIVMSCMACYFYRKNEELMDLYSDYYYKVEAYIFAHYKGKDLNYFYEVTD